MKHYRNFIVALTLLAFLLPAQSARADMAPPPIPKLGGLEPLEYQKTEVQMVYERVEMEIGLQENNPNDDSAVIHDKIDVSAYFLMRNTGKNTETMQAVFPSNRLDCIFNEHGESDVTYNIIPSSFKISIDGLPVTTSQVISAAPRPIPGICEQAEWVAFEVTFHPNQDVLVRVDYSMSSDMVDPFENFEYILETGAGWKGPIERGYVVVKFPYTVGSENILEGTSSGYQKLYNEIFWSFQNLEPQQSDNIHVNIVAPQTWQKIQGLRQSLNENPTQPEQWVELAQTYRAIATRKVDFVRSFYYFDQVNNAYEQGIAANPNNAELYAQYAMFKLENISPRMGRVITEEEAKPIVALYNKAKALDPKNKTMQLIQGYLPYVAPFLTLTPPPTIPSTATPAVSSTPTETPSPSITPKPSQTPIVEQVIVTKIVTATPGKATPTATATSLPAATATPTTEPDATQNRNSNSNWILWPTLLLIGFAGGVFMTKKKII